ncbi:alpha/beta hydrolase family protein [Corticibacterium sp. UT-5YL-CI-8]|nr:alpha/beta hydrolase family protein [Tianweitania sp. UT-5YL-CI-8]
MNFAAKIETFWSRAVLSGAVLAAAVSGFVSTADAASRIEARESVSPALGRPLDVNVYVPDGMAPSSGWPVLYLLHGHGGNQNSWTTLGNIQQTLDYMISEKEISPLIVVMPAAQNSWYVDSASVKGPGDYETALTKDLVSWVQANYPTRTDKSGRAIAGLSMGGFGALRLAYSHPELYSSTVSMSGAIWNNVSEAEMTKTPDDYRLIQNAEFYKRLDKYTLGTGRILPSVGDHYDGSFGTPFNAALFNRENLFTLAQDAKEAGVQLPPSYITVGDDDGWHLWRGAIALHQTLLETGQPSQLRVTDGDHLWSLWKVVVADALEFVNGNWGVDDAPAVVAADEPVPAKIGQAPAKAEITATR